jgi:hypothetical protein
MMQLPLLLQMSYMFGLSNKYNVEKKSRPRDMDPVGVDLDRAPELVVGIIGSGAGLVAAVQVGERKDATL